MAAVERLDMLLNDAMYGILFRDINMCRTFVDQYVSRRFIARSGIVINTGEDNYLTTADAVEKAHTVLAEPVHQRGVRPARRASREEQMGLGHAYEINPWLEDSFLLEIAQAQLIRQIFDRHPIKWMPPTKHKTGDIFFAHVHDAMFNLVGVTTHQSIELLGHVQRGRSTTRCSMDRYLSLKATRYVFTARRAPGRRDRVQAGRHRRDARRAGARRGARRSSRRCGASRSGRPSARGAFADVKRTRTGGKGYAGVVARHAEYVNPILEALEKGA